MIVVRYFKIRAHERGLMFRDRDFVRVLRPGRHFVLDVLRKVRVDRVSVRDPWLRHAELDVIARSGALAGEAQVIDLAGRQRALVWIDGRVDAVLRPGLHALWTVFRRVEVETFETRSVRFEHAELPAVLQARGAGEALDVVSVGAGHAGVLFVEGRHVATLGPGTHATWQGAGRVRIAVVDLREQTLDVGGQDIVTADKVTLRLNAVVTHRVVDPLLAVTAVEDCRQALYRDAQLALRAVVGGRELDALLSEKEAVARELDALVRTRAAALGVEVIALGIRDVILPGDMKELMNKVTEARKAAEANLITRREETAAMRSQANTARVLEQTPVLMRLRELETLERIAGKAKLSVVVGEGGLTDRLVKLL